MLRRLGFISMAESLKITDGTSFLQHHSFYEKHESGAINAKPEEIIAAVAELDMRDDKVANVLLSLRELPGKIKDLFRSHHRKKKSSPFGFDTFTLLRRSSHELSLGLAGRFWRPDLVISEVADAREFQLLDDPKVAKLVLRFQVIEYSDYITLLTETFVYCPNTRIKVMFAPYWLAIRLASGWIRQRTLASIERKLSIENG